MTAIQSSKDVMLVVNQSNTIELFKSSGSKRRRTIDAIKRESSLRILERHNMKERTLLAIFIRGAAAKVPSTSNSKGMWFPKKGIGDLLRKALASDTKASVMADVSEALAKLEAFRVIAGKNPDHIDRLDAMSEMFESVRAGSDCKMFDSPENRMFVQVVLPRTARGDSHNYTKPLLDWLQTIGVLTNDRNADAFAIRADRFPMAETDDTLMVIVRPYSSCLPDVSYLVRAMVNACP
jgi:uncharacterized protein (DUF885 family)